jgi:hypothetical protein
VMNVTNGSHLEIILTGRYVQRAGGTNNEEQQHQAPHSMQHFCKDGGVQKTHIFVFFVVQFKQEQQVQSAGK